MFPLNSCQTKASKKEYTPILYKRYYLFYYLFHYFSLMKSSENCFYFLTCILPDYMAHNFPKEFWKNSHFENMTAVFLLRCLNSLRWEISLIYHWNIDLNSAIFSGGAGGARAPPELGGSHKGQSLISAYQSSAITTNTPGFEKLNTALLTVTNQNI